MTKAQTSKKAKEKPLQKGKDKIAKGQPHFDKSSLYQIAQAVSMLPHIGPLFTDDLDCRPANGLDGNRKDGGLVSRDYMQFPSWSHFLSLMGENPKFMKVIDAGFYYHRSDQCPYCWGSGRTPEGDSAYRSWEIRPLLKLDDLKFLSENFREDLIHFIQNSREKVHDRKWEEEPFDQLEWFNLAKMGYLGRLNMALQDGFVVLPESLLRVLLTRRLLAQGFVMDCSHCGGRTKVKNSQPARESANLFLVTYSPRAFAARLMFVYDINVLDHEEYRSIKSFLNENANIELPQFSDVFADHRVRRVELKGTTTGRFSAK